MKTLVSLYAAVGGAQQQLLQRKSGVAVTPVACKSKVFLGKAMRWGHLSVYMLNFKYLLHIQ